LDEKDVKPTRNENIFPTTTPPDVKNQASAFDDMFAGISIKADPEPIK
jgi:hypothetical protein